MNKIIAALAAGLLAVGLVGCGDGEAERQAGYEAARSSALDHTAAALAALNNSDIYTVASEYRAAAADLREAGEYCPAGAEDLDTVARYMEDAADAAEANDAAAFIGYVNGATSFMESSGQLDCGFPDDGV